MMGKHDWLLEVLEDIAVYARANGLTEIANSAIKCKVLAINDILVSTIATVEPAHPESIHQLLPASPDVARAVSRTAQIAGKEVG